MQDVNSNETERKKEYKKKFCEGEECGGKITWKKSIR